MYQLLLYEPSKNPIVKIETERTIINEATKMQRAGINHQILFPVKPNRCQSIMLTRGKKFHWVHKI